MLRPPLADGRLRKRESRHALELGLNARYLFSDKMRSIRFSTGEKEVPRPRNIAGITLLAIALCPAMGWAEDGAIAPEGVESSPILIEGGQRTPMHAAARSGFSDYVSALEFGENAFAFGDYAQVIRVLSPWLMPSPVDSATTRNAGDGYAWLAAAAWFEARPVEAREVLRAGLRVNASMTLDPLVFPPELVQFFRDVREEMQPELNSMNAEGGDNVVYIESRVVEHSIWVSMIPFGYGMFANGRSDWGIAYAFTEASLLAVTTSLFWANYAERTASDDPSNPLGYRDPRRAELRRRIHVGTGWALLGLVATNMIHGALIHERQRRVQYRTLSGPPEGIEEPRLSRHTDPRPRRWSISFHPILELSPRPPVANDW